MTTNRSSKKQRELLNFVDKFIKEHGYGPSYREIMNALGYKSVSTVAIHIDNLIVKGYLRKHDKSARSLEVVTLKYDDSKIMRQSLEPAQYKVLVDAINERFEKLNKNQPKVLDEIYVLVGALKVLDLQNAYTATRARLAEYLKT
jgi:SOS-response transcriptional repressor LexA